MKNIDDNNHWNSFLTDWQGIVFDFVDEHQLAGTLNTKVPESWLNLVKSPDSQNIQNLWLQAKIGLPRFTSYLSWAILDARIAESDAGYLLIYYLKDWNEVIGLYEDEEIVYENGFVISGTPAKLSTIRDFEEEIGQLPIPLKELWLVHGFIQLRHYNFLASLELEQQKLALSPKVFPQRSHSFQAEQVLDCLGIADISGQTIPCLTHTVGSQAWQDYIVSLSLEDETISGSSSIHLDDLLSDWLIRRW